MAYNFGFKKPTTIINGGGNEVDLEPLKKDIQNLKIQDIITKQDVEGLIVQDEIIQQSITTLQNDTDIVINNINSELLRVEGDSQTRDTSIINQINTLETKHNTDVDILRATGNTLNQSINDTNTRINNLVNLVTPLDRGYYINTTSQTIAAVGSTYNVANGGLVTPSSGIRINAGDNTIRITNAGFYEIGFICSSNSAHLINITGAGFTRMNRAALGFFNDSARPLIYVDFNQEAAFSFNTGSSNMTIASLNVVRVS